MLGVRFFFFGCNNSFCGCNISFCSYNISFCGCNISFCGYNISFCGCNISFFDCNISFCGYNNSFCGYNISFCGYNISFCGCNISFCGCNNSKSDCYILFSACSKSKRDLCFSYATTYNLVDAFLSFKVLHETDAQRSAALKSGDESTPSHYKYRKNFKLNNRAIPKKSRTSPLFKTVVVGSLFTIHILPKYQVQYNRHLLISINLSSVLK